MACLLLAGCAIGTPEAPTAQAALPAKYLLDQKENSAAALASTPAASVAWQDFFADTTLQDLLQTALQNNRDLRLASLRVQEAQAAYGIQRSQSYPTLGLSAEAGRSRTPADLSVTGRSLVGQQFQVGLGISSWEIDFWGRLANLNEAALQSFLATDSARQATTLSLIGQVANAYLSLRELQERLFLAQANATSQQESLRIFTRRFEVGSASRLELTQVQTLQMQAQALVVQLQQQQALQLHVLELLLGTSSKTAALHSLPALKPDSFRQQIDAGLPSELLLNRPDIITVEHQLQAANANIGAARAAFYPNIRLTAIGGLASGELENLFQGAARSWSFAPSLTLPIFDAGRNQANLDLATVRQEMALASYEKTIQTAFREVADALASQQWLKEQVDVLQNTLDIQKERVRLSRLSYDNGASAFLEVLDAERSLLSAEQQLVQTRFALLASHVALYSALGGGSQALSSSELTAN